MKIAMEENLIQSLNSSVEVAKTGRRRRVWKKRKDAMNPKMTPKRTVETTATKRRVKLTSTRMQMPAKTRPARVPHHHWGFFSEGRLWCHHSTATLVPIIARMRAKAERR